MNYYNDSDQKAGAWLRELIEAGEIAPGVVDDRSITEVKADELRQYDQCHFFAGVGGWPLALRWAGLDDVPGIWTGSCPCQPFSCAGQRKGAADERHLWPVFFGLIRDCGPSVVFGEQVASSDVIGKARRRAKSESAPVWLDGVRGDLEGEGYAFGAAVMGAFSVGAPHRRQRLYWVADAEGTELELSRGAWAGRGGSSDYGATGRVEVSVSGGFGARSRERSEGEESESRDGKPEQRGGTGGVADVFGARLEGHARNERDGREPGREYSDSERPVAARGGARPVGNAQSDHQRRERESGQGDGRNGASRRPGAWDRFDIIPCRDGKARRIESKPLTLADGVTALLDALRHAGLSEEQIEAAQDGFPLTRHSVGRAMLLRGYGNGICIPLAYQFIMAAKETLRL